MFEKEERKRKRREKTRNRERRNPSPNPPLSPRPNSFCAGPTAHPAQPAPQLFPSAALASYPHRPKRTALGPTVQLTPPRADAARASPAGPGPRIGAAHPAPSLLFLSLAARSHRTDSSPTFLREPAADGLCSAWPAPRSRCPVGQPSSAGPTGQPHPSVSPSRSFPTQARKSHRAAPRSASSVLRPSRSHFSLAFRSWHARPPLFLDPRGP